MLNEFKKFAMRGNVVDMAVGIIIGAAFGRIISSLVNDVIMPPIGRLLGNVDFTGLFFNLGATSYETLAAAKAAGELVTVHVIAQPHRNVEKIIPDSVRVVKLTAD